MSPSPEKVKVWNYGHPNGLAEPGLEILKIFFLRVFKVSQPFSLIIPETKSGNSK